MKNWWKALMLGAVAVGGPAYAQAGPAAGGWGHGGGMMRMADADGDGVVTRAEYQAAVDQRFARMDANGDGVLTPDERPMRGPRRGMGGDAPPPPPPPPPPASAPGGPGAPPAGPMTRDQFRAAAIRRFDALDANHDGRIDATELQASRGGWRSGGDAPPPPPAGGQ